MPTTNNNLGSVLLFNKPYHVLCQFSEHEGKRTLAEFITTPKIYPAGRLDYDSEGLLLLTGNGQLQHRLTDPENKMPKTYWVQVEGQINGKALQQLQRGIVLKDGKTRPAKAKPIQPPDDIWDRCPPIRYRANIPTSWLELTITEGKNRQVRRMTAAVGFPTLRLIRSKIGPWSLTGLEPGDSQWSDIPELLLAKLKNQKSKYYHNIKNNFSKKPYHRSRAR